MNILLIGFMAAGKSTIANRISQEKGYKLISIDKEIERECNMTITEIFAQMGEEGFRLLERKVLSKVITGNNQIIDCGGGVAQHHADLIKQAGHIIYVYADFDIILRRLELDTTRPLANKMSREKLYALYLERDGIYRQLADEIIINN